jgi:hypothetical protein
MGGVAVDRGATDRIIARASDRRPIDPVRPARATGLDGPGGRSRVASPRRPETSFPPKRETGGGFGVNLVG